MPSSGLGVAETAMLRAYSERVGFAAVMSALWKPLSVTISGADLLLVVVMLP